MVFDVLKGIVLVVFTIFIFLLGFFAEVICAPFIKTGKQPLINKFIAKLWANSYKL